MDKSLQQGSAKLADWIIIAIITAAVIMCLAPFLHIVAISLSSNGEILSGRVSLWPRGLVLDAYKQVIMDTAMLRSLGFTVLLTAIFTLICMVMTICAAYPLTKERLKGRNFFLGIIVVTMFFSGGMIPDYLLVKELGLLNKISALILPGMVSAFYLIIMKTFFSSIPSSLEESAYLDGCSHLGILIRIIVPLSLPVIATLSLFYAVGRWNTFMDALLYITDPTMYPIQLKLYHIIMNNMVTELTALEGASQSETLPESLKAASIIFATAPILLVYPWLQRYFISGMMLGAVKG